MSTVESTLSINFINWNKYCIPHQMNINKSLKIAIWRSMKVDNQYQISLETASCSEKKVNNIFHIRQFQIHQLFQNVIFHTYLKFERLPYSHIQNWSIKRILNKKKIRVKESWESWHFKNLVLNFIFLIVMLKIIKPGTLIIPKQSRC